MDGCNNLFFCSLPFAYVQQTVSSPDMTITVQSLRFRTHEYIISDTLFAVSTFLGGCLLLLRPNEATPPAPHLFELRLVGAPSIIGPCMTYYYYCM